MIDRYEVSDVLDLGTAGDLILGKIFGPSDGDNHLSIGVDDIE